MILCHKWQSDSESSLVMNTPSSPSADLVAYLETLNEPHILCDRDYRIVAANRAYRAHFAQNETVIGRPCYAVSHGYDAPCDQSGETCPLALARRSGQRERVLHQHHTPQGEMYVSIELTPIGDGAQPLNWFIERMEPLPVRGDSGQGLSGQAPAFRRMIELVSRVAPSEAAVLLQGESGTGKELVAQAIHRASPRAHRPFVVVDCSGLPETLFESELFGHERGAFTGASQRKAGLVEAANGGTLFLDELGDIPLSMQVKLLRLLETGTFRRVGSTALLHTDIRIISATHRPLAGMVAAGQFRADLFYRINTFPIRLPPLRERREDIPLLVESLLARVAAGRSLSVSPSAWQYLLKHDFPGNIRELRNCLERASVLCDGNILEAAHFEVFSETASTPPPAPASMTEDWRTIAEQHFAQYVAQHVGDRKSLAKRLGISERTLYRRLQQLQSSR